MLHCSEQGHNHPKRIHGRFFASEVRMPEVGDRAMGGLKLFDECAVFPLASKVGGDETGAAVDLGDLICEHVSIVVVAGHAEATICPTDDLHGRRIADEVLELTASSVQEASRKELLFVVVFEYLVHDLPETLLPFENRFLRDDVRNNLRFQASAEEYVREVLNVIQRVVIYHYSASAVLQLTPVNNHGLVLHILREEGRKHAALAHLLPSSGILTTNGMALKEHRPLETQFDVRDVDGVAGDGDAIPALAHCAVWRAQWLE
mmetsp:Transcript_148350/g.413270  ORF Transcript_148350/g.413270 Transcript_148350/m.413270 type:complete len:262 (+) Transcript_148350:580-1365(+)